MLLVTFILIFQFQALSIIWVHTTKLKDKKITKGYNRQSMNLALIKGPTKLGFRVRALMFLVLRAPKNIFCYLFMNFKMFSTSTSIY